MPDPSPRPASVLVAGITRDTAPHLPAVFANIARVAGCFARAQALVVENDSVDGTKAVLADWAAAAPGRTVLTLDGTGRDLPRTQRIALVRNALLDRIREDASLAGHDRLCLMDMDDAATRPLDPSAIAAAEAFLDSDPANAGVFANQIGLYYDMWALRHPQLCPDDPWLEVLAAAFRDGLSDEEACSRTIARRLFEIAPEASPVEVDSAFGGLGLYRMDAVLANPERYTGLTRHTLKGPDGHDHSTAWQVCEHVGFHAGLRRAGGRLFIYPALINRDCSALRIVPSSFRGMFA